jgi:hypothetical protein
MDKIAELFQKLADKFAPQVIDASLGAAQMQAVSSLFDGVYYVVASVFFFYCGRKLCRAYRDAVERDSRPGYSVNGNEADETYIFVAYVCYGISLALFIASAVHFVDPLAIASVFHPEYWIANKVLGL